MGVAGTQEKPRMLDVQQRKDEGLFRAIKFSKVALLVNLAYFLWRLISILRVPRYAHAGEVAAYVAFFVMEWTFAVTGILNALLLSGLGKTWSPQKPQRAALNDVPSIDVFLPCYGETLDIIRDTLMAAIHQDYPSNKFRVILLDDGNSQDARELITKISQDHPLARLHYATRGAVIKIHSKAANINFGREYVQKLEGGAAPFFGVLDIDMIPTVDWLRATIPFLTEDPLVALAGSPQKFYNLPHHFCLASRYHLETDVMQRLFDSKGKALCMGSGYLMRRSIIEEIGGFPAMIKQEDTFIVSIILQAHGYRTRLLEEEHQYGLYAITFTDLSKNMAKWMTGMIHAYSLFWHPIMADKPLAAKIGGIFPILHLTVLRLFMMLSLPTILWIAHGEVVPIYSGFDQGVTILFAFIAYSTMYLLYWQLSIASGGTISLDDGQRLWHLPFQVKAVFWLIQHSIFGETKMPRFTTTGADVAATRKKAATGFIGRLWQTVYNDGAWVHMVYLSCLIFTLYQRYSWHSQQPFPLQGSALRLLASSIAYPPFTKIIAECMYQSFVPVLYCLSPDPNSVPRESFLETNEKTGVTQPTKQAATPYQPPFLGTLGNTAVMWLFFAAVPLALAFRAG